MQETHVDNDESCEGQQLSLDWTWSQHDCMEEVFCFLPIKIDTQVNQNLKEHSQRVHLTPFFVKQIKGEAELSRLYVGSNLVFTYICW